MNIVEMIEKEQMRADIPDFQSGDTVRVNVRIIEGQKQRIQAFEGVVIRKRGGTAAPALRSERFPTASAWREHSRCTRPSSTASRW